MDAGNRPFPTTLVLPFTTLYSSAGCPAGVAIQIAQGNTFSVAFDMTQAPIPPARDGSVYLKTDPQSNFVAAQQIELANEGLRGVLAFFSTGLTQAQIFGEQQTVTQLFLKGIPKGDIFTWQTAMRIGASCIVSNGAVDEDILTRLKQPS